METELFKKHFFWSSRSLCRFLNKHADFVILDVVYNVPMEASSSLQKWHQNASRVYFFTTLIDAPHENPHDLAERRGDLVQLEPDALRRQRRHNTIGWLSKTWKISKKGNPHMKGNPHIWYRGFNVVIFPKDDEWKWRVKKSDSNREYSPRAYGDEASAKYAALHALLNAVEHSEKRLMV